MLEIFGYIASILIGISLGLFGAGGTILTLPILVYLFGINPYLATSYSLLIVGVTSLTGSLSYLKNELTSFKTAFTFAIPSIFSVVIIRRFILPLIPEVVFTNGSITITRDLIILLFFSLLMLAAALSMIKNNSVYSEPSTEKNSLRIIINGIFVGIITGTVGAGGGFLIIPSLVLLLGLPIKKAVGTSLLIIAINSFTGFLIDFASSVDIDYLLLGKITIFAMAGTFVGKIISTKIKSQNLKPVFGYFILTVAVYIILKETVLKII